MVSKFSFLTRFFTFVFILCGTNALFAQSPTASIIGTIKDTKKALQGVEVVAIHKSTGKPYSVLTDLDGHFTLNRMALNGAYKISVSFLGYQTEEQAEVFLTADSPTVLNMTLKEATNILEISNVPFNRKETTQDVTRSVTGIDKLK